MIELRLSSNETRYAVLQPASRGRSPIGCRVVSNANTTDASNACDAPAKMDAMPTSAATCGSTPSDGATATAAAPNSAPTPPPMVNNGASVPPDVPLPRYTDQDTNLSTIRMTCDIPT